MRVRPPDDAYSLPVRGRPHTDSEPFRSHISELFGQTAKHRGAGKLELGGPRRVIDRDDELAVANEARMYLARNLGTDDFLPAAGHTTEDKGVFQTSFVKQLVQSSTDRHRRASACFLFRKTSCPPLVTLTSGARPRTAHSSSLPSTRRETSLGCAPGGSSPVVVKSA